MVFATACGSSDVRREVGSSDDAVRSEDVTGSTLANGERIAEEPSPPVSLADETERLEVGPATTQPSSVTLEETQAVAIDLEKTVEEPSLPVTVVDVTGAVVTVESIERIIPLDGDIAEVVFALGLDERVVATDLSATYPPEADALPQIGYQSALSAEPIAAFEPTVLLATALAGPPETLDALRRLGFPLIILPNEPTSQGPGSKIRAVAAALGVPSRGEALAADVERAVAMATEEGECLQECPKVLMLYVRGTAAQLVFGESSPTRWLIEAAGGVDVSREIGVIDPTPISAEAIVTAAPDVLITTEIGLESVGGVDGLLEIPGLAGTPAGRKRHVLSYDAQLLLGNGPRVAELLTRLTGDLKAISDKGKE